MNDIKLSEVFDTKEDKNQFMRDAFSYMNKQPSLAMNEQLDRSTFKQSVFGLLKEKLKTINERYLIAAVSWLERESKEIDEMRRELMYISDNCKIKLKNQQESVFDKIAERYCDLEKIKSLSKNYYPLVNKEEHIPTMITFNDEFAKTIETPEFDIFSLESQVGQEHTLSVIGCYIFTTCGLYSLIQYKKFEEFVKEITKGYIRANPYHNDLHAADVTQTCFSYMKKTKLKSFLKLNDIDMSSVFLSCIVHDYKHPGYTNNLLANINNKIAIRYNDTNILESYHVSQTFKLIHSNEKFNIFHLLSKEDYRTIRKRMIGFVLATDMIFHFKQFNYLKQKISTYSIEKGNNRNKIVENADNLNTLQQELLEILIHACDISNPTKPYKIYNIWATKVVSEFWRQGDKEKSLGLPVSMNCDRETTTIAKCQIGFMNGIVAPFFGSIGEIFPELQFLVDNVNNNASIYKKIREEEESKAK